MYVPSTECRTELACRVQIFRTVLQVKIIWTRASEKIDLRECWLPFGSESLLFPLAT